MEDSLKIIKEKADEESLKKLLKIKNPAVSGFIAKYAELCEPEEIIIFSDSPEDIRRTRQMSLHEKEEAEVAIKGHTIHFDSYCDLARDKKNTRVLVPKNVDLGAEINTMGREEGLREIHELLKGNMKGSKMLVKFYCLGPVNSKFTIPCVQITDSKYVAHSEDLLFRQGYGDFVRLGNFPKFFRFVHSQGETVPAGMGLSVSKNLDRRRIFMDLEGETVYSVNTQYAGNTVGLKKLAMRLGIHRTTKEGWLLEHMFIMGVKGPGGRVGYFTGAYPSMCGKTSTAMIDGESIVGDDIAYLRNIGGETRAANAEKGMFGIIEGVNSVDDQLMWKTLSTPGEVIFSNVLVTPEGRVYWNGSDGQCPPKGVNHSGEWHKGKKDREGREITPSHKNARFTLSLDMLDNYDGKMEDPEGVTVKGMIYGGRDSDTWVPVEESFDWNHGIITKAASIESETTAAALGAEGIREFNPMSNIDFLSITIGQYIENNLKFGAGLRKQPKIFSVNYFIKGPDGNFLNHKSDKRVWLKWMELRAMGEAGAVRTPTGYIPKYQDLRRLFREVLGKEYSQEDYREQFTVRVPESLAKAGRIIRIYREKVPDTPKIVFEVLEKQRKALEEARKKHGDYIPPEKLPVV